MICFIIFINITLSFADDVEYNDLDDDNIIETSSIGTHELNINARSYIVLDRLSKNIIYGKNEFNKVN